MVEVGTVVDVRGNFIRRSAQTVKRNAKFLSNQAATVRSTARIVFPNARIAAADSSGISGFTLVIKFRVVQKPDRVISVGLFY